MPSKNVLVINSSPHATGNTAMLVSELVRGAVDAGHNTRRLDLRELNVNPCLACGGCRNGKGNPCVQKDDMHLVYEAWDAADVVVLASPVYWMQMNAPMMLVRDRLYARPFNDPKRRSMALILSAATPADQLYKMPEEYFDYLLGVLGCEDAGRIVAGGLIAPGDVRDTDFMRQAYELGKSL